MKGIKKLKQQKPHLLGQWINKVSPETSNVKGERDHIN